MKAIVADGTRQAERSRKRQREVLKAARELFFERGYRGTTIQQIADAAGYSKRTVYLDYANKDELFITICAEGGELLLDELTTVAAAELSVEACVQRYLDIYIRFSRERSEYFRMIFNESTPAIVANCPPQLRERVAGVERACLEVIVALFERAIGEGLIVPIEPWDAAGIFVGTSTGIILLSMAGSQTVFSQKTLETLVTKAIWAFWRGLSVTAEARAGKGR